ncbi:MAG: DUF1801 domain-containing protein [SAR202 cluster bacterium]|nr:DUF1801 domain-containing protein [SAR202 cluster bacterium]
MPKKYGDVTVEDYIASLPPERKEAIVRVRKVVRDNLPPGYEEGMAYGMICWYVPFSVLPKTYNGQPLGYIALASQKNYMSLYVPVYMDKHEEEWFVSRYEASGKKLDMGKSCVRFKRLDDLPLEVVAELVARTPVKEHIARYKKGRGEA